METLNNTTINNVDLFNDAATYAICSFKHEFTKFLPYKDLLSCLLVCKTWYYDVKNLPNTLSRILKWKHQKFNKDFKMKESKYEEMHRILDVQNFSNLKILMLEKVAEQLKQIPVGFQDYFLKDTFLFKDYYSSRTILKIYTELQFENYSMDPHHLLHGNENKRFNVVWELFDESWYYHIFNFRRSRKIFLNGLIAETCNKKKKINGSQESLSREANTKYSLLKEKAEGINKINR